MNGLLPDLEAKGFNFRLVGDQLAVSAPDDLLDDHVVDYLRPRKSQLMAECRLRDFVRLVIAYGTSHGLLLDADVVAAELDEIDRQELMTTELEDRQAWAQLLAYRLTRARIDPAWREQGGAA